MDELSTSLVRLAGSSGTVALFATAFIAMLAVVFRVLYLAYKGHGVPVAIVMIALALAGGHLYDRWESLSPGIAWGASVGLGIIFLILIGCWLSLSANDNMSTTIADDDDDDDELLTLGKSS